ncbi:enoyl-CoA hydratase [Aurantiacibacter poecillastricola]|uniref:enoyl-CoA hydratase n=1 Tax=Aurantiacibacter poecillastricola TaxID=3064385 RepID=UPI00274003B0|nr:enoyl-CoA hydratase [Aurantiacibacter sp. 219JJ12-13]MDP5260166.1 enoyl-CoA hydratase [Aurantiacibacter sp. 219JJ12-13]
MSGTVDITQDAGVLTLLMNRPDKKNALTDAMYGAMASAMEQAEADPAVRVVAIRGAGDLFCAGNDIGDFLNASNRVGEANVFRFIRLLGSFTKPLLVGVQGRAVGIGTTMLLHCDHVVLAEDAKLSTPFVNLGLVPEAASSLLLPAAIGHQRAFAMLAMGEVMEAQEALAAGLANTVVPNDELDDAVAKAALRFSALPPGAVQATKALMRDPGLVAAKMEAEIELFAQRLQSAEAREAFTAFMEKREPDFSKF